MTNNNSANPKVYGQTLPAFPRIIVIGKTGHGKISALNALIDELKRSNKAQLVLSVSDTPDSGEHDQ